MAEIEFLRKKKTFLAANTQNLKENQNKLHKRQTYEEQTQLFNNDIFYLNKIN